MRKGQLVMLVTAVGINTTYGRIMASLVAPTEPTPLQEKLEHTAKLVGYVGLGESRAEPTYTCVGAHMLHALICVGRSLCGVAVWCLRRGDCAVPHPHRLLGRRPRAQWQIVQGARATRRRSC